MSKNKKTLMMPAKGGTSRSDTAASLHVSKRDVSASAKAIREHGLTFDAVSSMSADAVDDLFFPKEEREANEAYLQQDMAPLVERKKKNRRLPVEPSWIEHRERAEAEGRLACSHRMFARLFAEEAEEMGAARRFVHEAGAKCCIGWAGGAAFPTDRSLGAKAKAYVPVVTLPFSDKLWAGGFCDMKQKPRREGRMRAFGEFGGAPRMRAPDNAAAATDRTNAPRVALANKEHGRFADRRGAAVVPARVRRPRDESVAESCVDQVGQWIIGPAGEMAFYTIDELNGFCAERAARLDPRPFSAKDGPRDPVSEEEEETRLMPLPAERYEMCERRGAEVSPDCHATVGCMRYPVEHSLVGGQADVKPTPSAATVVRGGEIVAARPRLHGRKGQCPAVEDHMPEKRAALDSPRSPARLTSRARRIGPETEAAIGRALESRPIVGQPFVSCRNIPGLPKTCTPGLLERAPR